MQVLLQHVHRRGASLLEGHVRKVLHRHQLVVRPLELNHLLLHQDELTRLQVKEELGVALFGVVLGVYDLGEGLDLPLGAIRTLKRLLIALKWIHSTLLLKLLQALSLR